VRKERDVTNDDHGGTNNTGLLIQLGAELFPANEWNTLHGVAAGDPLHRRALVDFDDALWGPSLSRIADNRRNAPGTLGIPRHGVTRCDIDDRAIFKPIHYCAVYLTDPDQDIAWMTRNIVEMSGAHVEQLVQRIGPLTFLPVGRLLKDAIVKQRIEPLTWSQLWRYRGVYNAAKHQFGHPIGTHLFSIEDAVLAYAAARRLGQELYSLARLKTDWRSF
jgi:hypothetical protein